MRDSHIGHRIPVESLEHSRWFYVYHLYNEAGELLYIGQTADVYTRWTQHRRNQPWGDEIASVEVQRFAYLDLALTAERAAIQRDTPKYNIRSTPEDRITLGRQLNAARAARAEERALASNEGRLP